MKSRSNGNSSTSRLDKRARILHELRRQPGRSKIALARELEINATTVGSVVEGLIRDGLVVASGLEPSTGGRPGERLALNPDGPLAIGIDLGETAARFGLLDLAGRLVAAESLPFTRLPDGSVDPAIVSRGVARLLDGTDEAARVVGVGVAVPGVVERDEGLVRFAANLGWQDLALGERLARELDRPAVLDRNSHAALLAEDWWGSAADAGSAIFVTLGSGIGAAIRIERTFVRGVSGAAGEFGHIPIVADGPLCGCGRRGCLEALASSAAVQATYRRLASAESAAISDIAAAARAGDTIALHVLDEAARYLGTGIVTLVNLLNPSVVILGGELMEAAELLLPGVEAHVRQHALTLPGTSVSVVASSLHQDAALIGAASLAFEAMFDGAIEWPPPRARRSRPRSQVTA